jgi:uncharacterized protein YndB with AHSA1/START domain
MVEIDHVVVNCRRMARLSGFSAMPARVELSIFIAAPPDRVWAELADLASHPEWMDDAATVTFIGEQRAGVGTRMVAATRIGPLRARDTMDVNEWVEGRVIAVEHVGSVKGNGRFEIRPVSGGTELTWTENLRFPWWMGGPIGELVAQPILGRIWTGSLQRLKRRVELSGP